MKKTLPLALLFVFLCATPLFAYCDHGTIVLDTGACVELSDNITMRCPTNGTESGVLKGRYAKGDETYFTISVKHDYSATPLFDNASIMMDKDYNSYLIPDTYKLLPANFSTVGFFEFPVYHPKSAKYVYFTFTNTGGWPTGKIGNLQFKNQ